LDVDLNLVVANPHIVSAIPHGFGEPVVVTQQFMILIDSAEVHYYMEVNVRVVGPIEIGHTTSKNDILDGFFRNNMLLAEVISDLQQVLSDVWT
jgi:hypothetical protein